MSNELTGKQAMNRTAVIRVVDAIATGRQAMNRITAIRVVDAIAIFLVAHLALYGFTGLALWGVNIEFGRGFALVMLHVVGLFAPMIARELR